MIITHIDIFKSRDISGRKTATIHFFLFFLKNPLVLLFCFCTHQMDFYVATINYNYS